MRVTESSGNEGSDESARSSAQQAQTLIGGALFDARMAAGLTALQVSETTRISPEMLRRLEAGQFGACGGDVYARGHIRAFAAAVNLDPAPLLAQYGAIRLPPLTRRDLRKPKVAQSDSPSGQVKPPTSAQRARSVLPTIVPGVVPSLVPMAGQTPPTNVPPLSHGRRGDFTDVDAGSATNLSLVDREAEHGPARNVTPAAYLAGSKDRQKSGPNWSLALVGALAAVGLVAAVQLWPDTGEDAANAAGVPAAAHNATTTAPPSAAAISVPIANATPTPVPTPTAPVTVQVTTKTGDSWVGVTNAAGQQLFWNIQAPGQTQQFTDTSQINLTVGDAAAVDVTVNGHDLGSPGTSGEVFSASYGPKN